MTEDITGDAMASTHVRGAEVEQSFRLLRQITEELCESPDPGALAEPMPGELHGEMAGWAEAAQGEVLYIWLLTFADLLASADRHRPDSAVASVTTFAFGKISGAALLVALLLLASRSGGLAHVPPGPLHSTAWTLLVVTFAVKVALIPVQVWMPRGYAAAPAGLPAVMAGVAVNAGFYGLWRALDLLGRLPAWLALTLPLVAALTALLGIAHARRAGASGAGHRILQRRERRLDLYRLPGRPRRRAPP